MSVQNAEIVALLRTDPRFVDARNLVVSLVREREKIDTIDEATCIATFVATYCGTEWWRTWQTLGHAAVHKNPKSLVALRLRMGLPPFRMFTTDGK